jgi:hypothetical protein
MAQAVSQGEPMTNTQQATINLRAFYAIVKNLSDCDASMVAPQIDGLTKTSQHDQCYIATYKRIHSNIKSILALNDVQHFQAINMIVRSIFELLVDLKLLDAISDGPQKMLDGISV